MAIIRKEFVAEDCLLAIWEIAEDYETLFSKVHLTVDELKTLNGFLNNQRKLEWLSVRVLLNEVLEKNCRIVYNADHKPFLADNSYNISISHSKNLTSVLLSKNKRVGIDLEFMSHQIHNIAHKFINDDEFITKNDGLERIHLYIHWCAKEALYKICDKQDINFKQNLTITPFESDLLGKLEAHVHNRFGREKYNLEYFVIDGYTVVWCSK